MYDVAAAGVVYAGSFGSPERKQVLTDAVHAVYVRAKSGSGYLVYVRQGSLMAQPFDADALSLTGEAHMLADNVEAADFAISNEGTLAFRSDDVAGAELISFTHAGHADDSLGRQTGVPGEMRFSPNGAMIAIFPH